MKNVVFSFRRTFAIAGAIVLLTGLLAACKKTDGVATRIPAAGLMAFNLAPDKDGIGIALSGNLLNNTPLYYTSFNGHYQNVYTGTREIEVFDFSDSVFSRTTFNFEDNEYYSMFVTGHNGAYSTITVKDDIDSSASSEKAYVRYINAIPDSSSPVVSITSGGSEVSNGSATFNSVSPFVAVDGGDVKITVSNGTNISADRTIALQKGSVYTALLVGVPGATDEGKKVQIKYVLNGSVPTASEK